MQLTFLIFKYSLWKGTNKFFHVWVVIPFFCVLPSDPREEGGDRGDGPYCREPQ